jgi:hypothetical protein
VTGKGVSSSARARHGAGAVCAALVAVEAIGAVSIWAPIPVAWVWIGARVYGATASLLAAGFVTLLGILASTVVVLRVLARVDGTWIAIRRRTGHDQAEGALTQVVVITATLGIVAFLVWYYVLAGAFILPFMPND